MKHQLIQRLALSLRNLKHSSDAGFSMAEAVSTIAIGLVLTAIAIPSYGAFRTAFEGRADRVEQEQAARATAYETQQNALVGSTTPASTPGSL